MASLNKACLIGHLGNDPEVRSTQDGREIASFSLATSETWKDKHTGERKSKTEWHKIVVFNEGLVKVIKSYIKKGSKLYLEGQILTRKWTDRDGIERYTTEIVLQNFGGVLTILDSRKDSQDTPSQHDQAKANGYVPEELNDEIPF